MTDLNSMSRMDLMKKIDAACKAISEINKAQGERTLKEWDLSSVQGRLQGVLHYDADVGKIFIFSRFFIGFFVSSYALPALGYFMHAPILCLPIFSVFLGCVIAFASKKSKRKKMNKKFQKQVKENGTVEHLQNEIREAQRQLAIAENKLREAHRKNDSVIKIFPMDYQSLPKLQGIYQILYNQRAMNWANAASLYMQEEMQRKKLQEEMRHNQQMEQAQQELIRKQEEQTRRLENQQQMRMEQEERLARDVAHEIEGLRSDLSSRR